MPEARGYLLDTNIVLLATRQDSRVSDAIDAQFQLGASRFRPAICEVTIAELLAFATAWSSARRDRLSEIIRQMLVIEISEPGTRERWAELYSHAKSGGMGIQHHHNDVWIAAATHVSGLTLLSTDGAAFLPLCNTPWLDVVLIDPKTGLVLA